jgi:hypothetical protein
MVVKQQTVATKKQHAEFQDRVAGYPEEYLSCRDFGHSWRPVTAEQGKGGVIKRTLGCANCDAQRNQTLDKFGYVLTNSYGYSAGYIMPGVGRLTAAQRATLRLANLAATPSI